MPEILCTALSVYTFILFAHVLLSWALVAGFRPPIDGPVRAVVDGLDTVTRPVLGPLRGMLPALRLGGVGIDLSVLVAFIGIAILQSLIGC